APSVPPAPWPSPLPPHFVHRLLYPSAGRRGRLPAKHPFLRRRRPMPEAFICDAVRTPIGRYAGSLSSVRPDDLGAVPLKTLMARNPNVDWGAVDDVIFGCANQAG